MARKCIICGKPLEKSKAERARAFCSERCRMVDLGRWMGGEYKVPGPPADDEEIASEVRRGSSSTRSDGDYED